MTDLQTGRAAAALSRPFAVRGLTSRNRIAMAPMTRQFSPAACPAVKWRTTTPGAPRAVSG